MVKYSSGITYEVKSGSQVEAVDGMKPGWYAQWYEDMVDGPSVGPFQTEEECLAATFLALPGE